MRPTVLLLLLTSAYCDPDSGTQPLSAPEPNRNETSSVIALVQGGNVTEAILNDGTVAVLGNDTTSDEHEPVVRKKRTFGDIVFRGLADVLGYNVARRPPQAAAFPPPLAPVPGIDLPLAGPAAPAAPPPPPCGAPKAVAPPPCRAVAPPPPPPPPPKPKPPPPCPKPRAVPRPKPRPPPPPPPPPPPCAKPRANPTTPSPCAPPPPPPPPPKDNLETIRSNFRLQFDFNRQPASPAPAQAEELQQAEEEAPVAPVAIEPRAARLPAREPPRQPRVFVDAFVVRNGRQHRVRTYDANQVNPRQLGEDDYLAYDDEEAEEAPAYDDYEAAEESRDRAEAVREFGTAVDAFWDQKQKPPPKVEVKRKKKKKLPANDYRSVHFGDRELAEQIQRRSDERQSLNKERQRPQRVPLPLPEAEEEDAESTTTTEDPRRPLRPRVLPPTEHNPGQIDTVTVRVPPIYREKHPKKLNRGRPERPDRDEEDSAEPTSEEEDSDGENSIPEAQTEPPRRRQRRKKSRRTRSTHEEDEDDAYAAGDYDYFGNKRRISDEEKHFMQLTVPPPTKDSDLARIEQAPGSNGPFLDDHERLIEDPERIGDDERTNEHGRSDDSGQTDDHERLKEDKERLVDDPYRSGESERAGEDERAGEAERTDRLSPNAQVRETGYESKFLRATNVREDDPRPALHVKRKPKRA